MTNKDIAQTTCKRKRVVKENEWHLIMASNNLTKARHCRFNMPILSNESKTLHYDPASYVTPPCDTTFMKPTIETVPSTTQKVAPGLNPTDRKHTPTTGQVQPAQNPASYVTPPAQNQKSMAPPYDTTFAPIETVPSTTQKVAQVQTAQNPASCVTPPAQNQKSMARVRPQQVGTGTPPQVRRPTQVPPVHTTAPTTDRSAWFIGAVVFLLILISAIVIFSVVWLKRGPSDEPSPAGEPADEPPGTPRGNPDEPAGTVPRSDGTQDEPRIINCDRNPAECDEWWGANDGSRFTPVKHGAEDVGLAAWDLAVPSTNGWGEDVSSVSTFNFVDDMHGECLWKVRIIEAASGTVHDVDMCAMKTRVHTVRLPRGMYNIYWYVDDVKTAHRLMGHSGATFTVMDHEVKMWGIDDALVIDDVLVRKR